MKVYRFHSVWLSVLAAALMTGCVAPPAPEREAEPVPEAAPVVERVVKVDETAMLPLLGYLQLLARMTPQELQRERTTLGTIPQTPTVQVRQAMLLGQVRTQMDLARALALLEAVLKSNDPTAASLHPLARALVNQYNERLKLQIQSEKLVAQNERLVQQLNESLRRGLELQEKLDALADIERSLPVRPKNGETLPGAPR